MGDTVSHEGLQGRLATATAAYAAERDGYLPLRPDDCIVLECNRCEPGDELCSFKNYLYGKRLRGPSTDDGSAVSCGWFPESLVNFFDRAARHSFDAFQCTRFLGCLLSVAR